MLEAIGGWEFLVGSSDREQGGEMESKLQF